jgi:ElaB/YqjD/DUF883 family membrane-anchored ribosome-binding protein
MSTPFSNDAGHAVDSAADAASQTIRDTQRASHNALDHLADGMNSARAGIDGLANDSAHLAQRGSDAVARTARQWRDQAVQMRQSTRGYIEHQPLQAVLIAMAAGAALVLLGSLVGRARRGGPGSH